MSRSKLPGRRPAHTEAITYDGGRQPITATIGFEGVNPDGSPSGRPSEIFLDVPKTSPMSELARDSALLISIALQHGVEIEEMRAGVGRSEDGEPHTIAGAALDLLARVATEL